MNSTITEQDSTKAVANLLKDMEEIAANIRALILSMPPQDLLGYIYAQRMMKRLADSEATSEEHDNNGPDEQINEIQFLLEYVHAVLASDEAPEEVKFDDILFKIDQFKTTFNLDKGISKNIYRFKLEI